MARRSFPFRVVLTRSTSFVAAHWPPWGYRANRVPLSHANSLATAVIAPRRGLTSNTSWLVFLSAVGVSPLLLCPFHLFSPSHWFSTWNSLFLTFSPRLYFSYSILYLRFVSISVSREVLLPLASSPCTFPRSSTALCPKGESPRAHPRGARSRRDRKSTRHARFIFWPM